jgi:hypothetical protein
LTEQHGIALHVKALYVLSDGDAWVRLASLDYVNGFIDKLDLNDKFAMQNYTLTESSHIFFSENAFVLCQHSMQYSCRYTPCSRGTDVSILGYTIQDVKSITNNF